MRILWQLILADMRQHPARMALTSLAMIAAACMVVWVVSGYDALTAQFDSFASDSLGRYELVILPQAPRIVPGMMPPERHVPAELLAALRQDPSFAVADPVMQTRVMVRRLDPNHPNLSGPGGTGGFPGGRGGFGGRGGLDGPSGPAGGGPTFGGIMTGPPTTSPMGGGTPMRPPMMRPMPPMLVGTNAIEPPFALVQGTWIDPSHPDRLEAAVSSKSAEQLNVRLGDQVVVRARGGEPFQLKIVGIVTEVAQPGTGGMRGFATVRGPATAALYVPMSLAEKITAGPMKISYIGLALKAEVDLAQFRANWTPRLAKFDPLLVLQSPEDVKEEMSEGFSADNVRKQAYSATGISLLAALFIIFTTLSMGVSERIRQFAILRAVALTRLQVALLIAGESLVLAAIGWGGGLAAGWGLLGIMRRAKPELFGSGASLGRWCVLLSGICALGGALVASIIPAWRATRVSPLDALSPRQVARQKWWPVSTVAAGLLLIAVNPLLVFVVPMPESSRYGIYLALGCTSMAIGFILLAPLAVLIAERVFGPLLARLLLLEPGLLTSQLTSNLWRTVGTTVAMAIGLGLFVAMQTWGYSMLRPFVPGEWMPEMMMAVLPTGLPDSETQAIQHIKGVIPDQCLPLAVEQPKFVGDITGSLSRTTVTRQDNVVLIGMDPQRGLGDPSPLLNLEFVQGDRATAVRQLKEGRYCIVPDHFCRETGLGMGGKFKLMPPNATEPVEYTIAGVVSLPGWHWMSKFTGVRLNNARSAAMVFAAYDQVRGDFHLDKVRFFWLNTDESATPANVATAVQAIAERSTGAKFNIAAFGFPSMDDGLSIRVTTSAELRDRIATRADGMIWGMSQLPLVTLVVTSLGVINTVLASVRARRWEMGLLRALGYTRLSLVRLVLAEAVLVGMVACLLSLAFGVMAGWCGAGISQYVSFFGGLNPSLVIPWAKLSWGLGLTLLLCIAAALWPAISTGRAEPLRLLQAGRTVM
ncbi:MAG: ABC transporter permease [Bacillota bacterium]